ncbi:hypothetical protein NL108_016663 [Boleophthalmus pectinirostris]|nr:hypothetical protein NL108_016663 [Boleophthalmus pectinirostris]
MDTLDEITVDTLRAANVGEELLWSRSRDDIKDLLPGPENVLRHRALWFLVNSDEKVEGVAKDVEPSKQSAIANSRSPEDRPNPLKYLAMSSPKYTVYTDSELEQARSSYFEQKRLGSTTSDLSKELFCRLIRNTMTNMVSIARALEDSRYPSKHEVDTVAKRLVEYYPMLKGKKTPESEWGHVTKKLIKRLSNIKKPKKSQCTFQETSHEL